MHEYYDVNATGHFFVIQEGSSYDDFPYRAMRYQRGFGHYQTGRGILGSLGRMWKYLIPVARKYIAPIAKQALNAIGEEGVEAGAKILTNISKGADPKDALMSEGTQAFKKLATRAGKRITEVGQEGSGKRRRKKTRSLSNLHLVGRSVLENSVRKKGANLGLFNN